jgi:hypothetical protein
MLEHLLYLIETHDYAGIVRLLNRYSVVCRLHGAKTTRSKQELTELIDTYAEWYVEDEEAAWYIHQTIRDDRWASRI